MVECVYCGCPVEDHDPVFVAHGTPSAPTSAFCNYGCLKAHIDREELVTGTSCSWSPS